MIKKRVLFVAILTIAHVMATETTTTFGVEGGAKGDKYGNSVYERDVTIKTTDFKVDNFWSKFSNPDNKQSNHTNISKTGIVQVSVESTSLCSINKELDKEGCSGQKPFLINDEAIDGLNVNDTITLLFQKNLDGTDITYNDKNATVFYPLDVQRDEKFYKEEGEKSFKSFFQKLFDGFLMTSFFSGFFSHEVVDKENNPSEDIRQRYIANIVSGIDQNHLLEAAKTPLSTTTLNRPVSLIDYREDVDSAGSCNLFFFKFSEANSFCNIMGSMPFISMFSSTKPSTSYIVDTIGADTENALVSFAGTYADLNIESYQAGVTYQKQSESTGPISTMINMMKCFFFGCTKVNDVQEAVDSYYGFSDANAINLTFAITNEGDAIDDFETFRLMGIHSLSGNEHMCQVKESNWNDKWDSHTFTGNEEDTKEETTTTCDGFYFMGICNGTESTVTTTVANTYSAKYISETVQSNLAIDTDGDDLMTPSEWLTWCDYMVEKYKDNVTTECSGFFMFQTCIEVPADIEEDGYEVLSYTNDSKRGLLLDLKLIEPTPNDEAVTLRYKLLKTHN